MSDRGAMRKTEGEMYANGEDLSGSRAPFASLSKLRLSPRRSPRLIATVLVMGLVYFSLSEIVRICGTFSEVPNAESPKRVVLAAAETLGRHGLGWGTTTGPASPHITTWSDTPPGQICHQMFPFELSGEARSYRLAWEALRPSVLNATYYPDWVANETRFRNWLGDLFQFYTHERLQKSQAHPAPRESIRKIWDFIKRRIEDPVHNEPVRVAFFGGSVTSGRDCDTNPLDLPGTNNFGWTQQWCAYPNRLNVLLNRVLFPHISLHNRTEFPLFEVTNMAVQATSSEVGAMAMEYNLLPPLEKSPPHIIISSYSANDAFENEAETFLERQPAFVRAAHNIRPCDDHLPLVVMSDDWYSSGGILMPALTNTGSLYKTAVWHNLMAIMYSNVVRAQSIFHANFTDSEGHLPLYGSQAKSGAHLGMGFHIAQGWTIFFNLVGALHDACTEPQPKAPLSTMSNASSLATELAGMLPTKYMGGYGSRAALVREDWDRNAKFKEGLCDPATAPTSGRPAGERPPYSTSNCAYAWVVNPMTSAWVGDGVRKAIDHALVSQNGWAVKDRMPKSGWYTNLTEFNLTESAQARFTIEIRNLTQPVDTFTLLSLRSYGPEWIGSRVVVAIEVIPDPGSGGASGGGGESPNPTTTNVGVAGYHTTKISVLHPNRFRLQGAGAHVGDTIRATFTLAGGKNFMVSGIAFCRSYSVVPNGS